MLARELMTRPVVTVGVDTPTKEAAQMLNSRGITAMPVLDEHDHVVGVLSEMDLLRDAVEPDARAHALPTTGLPEPRATVVGQVMSQHPLTVTESTDLAEIADIMMMSAVKSVPVVRAGRVVGIVSRSDVIRMLATTDEKIQTDVETLLAEIGEDDWQIDVKDGVVEFQGPADERRRRIVLIVARTLPGVVRAEFTG
jgi:CBS domain-containing protein